MPELLFLHGAMDVPDTPVRRRLEQALGAGYVVTAPDLGPPDPQAWGEQIADSLAALPPDGVIVGHSLGAAMALKVLAERMPGLPAAAFVALACPFWGLPGWDMPVFYLPPDFAAALHGIGRIAFFQDRADEVVDIQHLEAYGRCIPHAALAETPGTGHGYRAGGLAPVLAAIRGA